MAKGSKTGGRTAGTPNKATVERALVAQQQVAEAKAAGRKLGKEIVEDFAHVFASMAAFYQPQPGVRDAAGKMQMNGNPNANEGKFVEYAKMAVTAGAELANYQSPKLRAILVAADKPTDHGVRRKKFTLGIFDNQGRPAPKHINVAKMKPATPTAQ